MEQFTEQADLEIRRFFKESMEKMPETTLKSFVRLYLDTRIPSSEFMIELTTIVLAYEKATSDCQKCKEYVRSVLQS